MTARVYPQRHHHHHHHQEDSSSSNSSGGSVGGSSNNSSSKILIGDGSAAAVVAAVARLHQQQLQLQQHHLFLEESSGAGSPILSPCTTPSPGPKLADGRRANKPLMEKRRRARINQSLAALKALILDSARLENTKHSKLEKADILELTVRHLQRQRSLAQPGLSRYKAGYQDCSREVSRYLDAPDIITGNTSPIDPAFKQRLLRHLDSCVSELDLDLGSRPDSGLGSSPGSVTDRVLGPGSPVPLDHPHHAVAAAAAAAAAAHCSAALGAALIKQEIPELEAARPDSSTAPGDENNNSSRPTSAFGQVHPAAVAGMPGMEQPGASQPNPNMLSVVQVIPSRLPDGQVVFLLPSHYVQLAAAAAANGISIGPNPPTAIWAATNMSLLKATDKLIKRPLCDDGGVPASEWPSVDPITGGLKPPKSPRIEPPTEQPLDFTTSSAKKLKAAAARYVAQQQAAAAAAAAAASHDPAAAVVGIAYNNSSSGNGTEDRPPSIENTANGCNSSSSSSSSSSSGSVLVVSNAGSSCIVKEEKTATKLEVVAAATPLVVAPVEVEQNGRTAEERHSPSGLMMQPVKDEEGMWRPW